ncbi:hypothetical protein QBC46DRAFT_382595 [Diplogelasinospora grovesii]|uniref:Nucleoside 2-deoxyribosyltransferase domain-containing protein n=1 Tax=Diplogelasinospora grovesii TaxID=303347 RepID=A0AAN6S512_9PEZI|nr:hypothetical protein QBC46DRAFT_382595 [Diplogelasinospora grovesii]
MSADQPQPPKPEAPSLNNGTQPPKAEIKIIPAPSRPKITGMRTYFLAGTTTNPDWRQPLITSLSSHPIAVFNPLRPDWDSSWLEDPSFPPFKEQVEWELEMQERAHVVVFYFGPHTDAPISLLELGLCAPRKCVIVACHPDYKKRGNVLVLCQKYGHVVVDDVGQLADAVRGNFLG